jgi:hypothetical protein
MLLEWIRRSARVLELHDQLAHLPTNYRQTAHEAARDFATKALAANKKLDALLAVLEYTLYSGEMPPDLGVISENVEGDPLVEKFTNALNDESPATAKNCIATFESIDHSKLSKGYVLDVFLANFYGTAQNSKQRQKLLWVALKSNPYITSVYSDLAQSYQEQWDIGSVFELWDLGMQLNPDHVIFDQVKQHMREFQERAPDFL